MYSLVLSVLNGGGDSSDSDDSRDTDFGNMWGGGSSGSTDNSWFGGDGGWFGDD